MRHVWRAAALGAVLALAGACAVLDVPPLPTRTPAPVESSGPALALAPPDLPPPGDGAQTPNGALLGSGANDATAAALPSGQSVVPTQHDARPPAYPAERIALGGIVSGGALVTPRAGAPMVLLLGETEAAWGPLPTLLADVGLAALAVRVPRTATTADFGALLDALAATGMVEVTGVVALAEADMAGWALAGCAAEVRCAAVGLVGPTLPQNDDPLGRLARYNPRPLLIVAAQQDDAAQALGAAATGEVLFQPVSAEGRGARLLQDRPDVAALVVAWAQRVAELLRAPSP